MYFCICVRVGLWVYVFLCVYMYACICVYVWMCVHAYMYICIYVPCVDVFVCKNSKRRDEIFFCPCFLSSLFLPTVSPSVSLVSATISVLCPLSLTLALQVCHSLGLSLSLVPLPPSTQSLCWHRSTGYLGNHCRVITCDWPGWGLTLGWQADFGGDSCPQSPLREGHSSEQEGDLSVHGEQSPLAGEGIPILMRTWNHSMRPQEHIPKKACCAEGWGRRGTI